MVSTRRLAAILAVDVRSRAASPRMLIFLSRENTVPTEMLCETPIKGCDLTLVGGSKCLQYGTPFLRLGQIDHQVEWFSQGISEDWPFQVEKTKPMSRRFSVLFERSKRSGAFEAREISPESAILNWLSASWLSWSRRFIS